VVTVTVDTVPVTENNSNGSGCISSSQW